MILVDSSVWIDYFRGILTAETDRLDGLLGVAELVVGDIILTEVLQGFGKDRDFAIALDQMAAFPAVMIGGAETAIAAARNFRHLRAMGITVRKTIDTLIATHCIQTGTSLLFSDRDFDPFVAHLGLQAA